MATMHTRAQIDPLLARIDVIAAMERAFAAYSPGEAAVPPVGQLDFVQPPGGLASGNGVVMVFSSQTGELLTIFQDEGYLTDIRTAAAGAGMS